MGSDGYKVQMKLVLQMNGALFVTIFNFIIPNNAYFIITLCAILKLCSSFVIISYCMHVGARATDTERNANLGWNIRVWPPFELKTTNKYNYKTIYSSYRNAPFNEGDGLVPSCMLQIAIHIKRIMNIENVERKSHCHKSEMAQKYSYCYLSVAT